MGEIWARYSWGLRILRGARQSSPHDAVHPVAQVGRPAAAAAAAALRLPAAALIDEDAQPRVPRQQRRGQAQQRTQWLTAAAQDDVEAARGWCGAPPEQRSELERHARVELKQRSVRTAHRAEQRLQLSDDRWGGCGAAHALELLHGAGRARKDGGADVRVLGERTHGAYQAVVTPGHAPRLSLTPSPTKGLPTERGVGWLPYPRARKFEEEERTRFSVSE